MKVLEILNEAAPEGRSFDIQELVKTFKTKAQIEKHVHKLWGTDKLTFKGQAFFAGSDFGPVMKNAMAKADKGLGRALEVDLEYKSVGNTVDIAIDEKQLAYVGYSQTNDMLYFGYDVWLNSEELEKEFDNLYEDETGEEFDPDNMETEKEWKNFIKQNPTMYSVLIELSSNDGKKWDADLLDSAGNGFYNGIRKTRQFKAMNLIDLMLK